MGSPHLYSEMTQFLLPPDSMVQVDEVLFQDRQLSWAQRSILHQAQKTLGGAGKKNIKNRDGQQSNSRGGFFFFFFGWTRQMGQFASSREMGRATKGLYGGDW